MSLPITLLSAARLLLSTLLKRTLSKPAPKHIRVHFTLPHPPADDHEAWKIYWKAQGQRWRTEPEIDDKRQEYLAQRRIISSDIEHGIYPFKDIKLNRADMEWLLATLDGRGPVDWNDESQRNRVGLDVRGADLRQVDLDDLPLARLCGGLSGGWWNAVPDEQLETAAVHLEGTILRTHLEGANLSGAHLEGADLRGAHLEQANCCRAHLEGALLHFARLESAFIRAAHLERAILYNTDLRKAILVGAHLENSLLNEAFLEGAHLEDVLLSDQRRVGPRMADTHWENVNLAVVKWSQVEMLGDEYEARQKRRNGTTKGEVVRLREYEQAARANRQLSVVLQSQGLNRDAARFAYRAQILERRALWFQMIRGGVNLKLRWQSLGEWFFSWFLFLVAGYGYRPARSFLAYLLIIGLFMTMYHIIDPHLAWNEAFVVSMTAFHGRGFSPSTFTPGDRLSFASAAEAFVGLIIEVTFIATLTQRFFNR